eukprot:7147868-Heterocapsa_arctica.AAC.1
MNSTVLARSNSEQPCRNNNRHNQRRTHDAKPALLRGLTMTLQKQQPMLPYRQRRRQLGRHTPNDK